MTSFAKTVVFERKIDVVVREGEESGLCGNELHW